MRSALLFALIAVATVPGAAAAQRPVAPDTTYAAVVSRAEHAVAARRWNEAVELLQWAVAGEQAAPDQWWELGHALFNARRHREAIAAFERAMQLGAGQPELGAWQISRAYAHRGNRKQALRWLAHAVELGFDGRRALREEPLFEQYRSDPRFSALSDPAATARRSAPRLPARARHAPVREVEPPRLAAAHALHAREQAVGATASVDHAPRAASQCSSTSRLPLLRSHQPASHAGGLTCAGASAPACAWPHAGVGANRIAQPISSHAACLDWTPALWSVRSANGEAFMPCSRPVGCAMDSSLGRQDSNLQLPG
jgi:hypothetical protein